MKTRTVNVGIVRSNDGSFTFCGRLPVRQIERKERVMDPYSLFRVELHPETEEPILREVLVVREAKTRLFLGVLPGKKIVSSFSAGCGGDVRTRERYIRRDSLVQAGICATPGAAWVMFIHRQELKVVNLERHLAEARETLEAARAKKKASEDLLRYNPDVALID